VVSMSNHNGVTDLILSCDNAARVFCTNHHTPE
jgi:hypothetical protein